MFTEMNDTFDPNSSNPANVELSDGHEDWVMNYASLVIGFGLIAENFHDPWREGEGGGLVRCWKFLLLRNGRTKYAVKAFQVISALLSPRKAHQLIWNHTCNPKGEGGNNIPLDLQNEFMNGVFKDSIPI